MVISNYIKIRYKTFIEFSKVHFGKYEFINPEMVYILPFFAISMYNIFVELENDSLTINILNFYYLFLLPIYFLSMVKISKKEE